MFFKKGTDDRSDERRLEDYLYASDRARISSLACEMMEAASALLAKAEGCIRDLDLETASVIASEDDRIDLLEEQLDQECLYSIAMRQPQRENLRYVYGIMKMITDIERIGDQAVNLSRLLRIYGESGNMHPLPRLDDINAVASKCTEMSGMVLKALRSDDVLLLKLIGERHDDVRVICVNSGTLLRHELASVNPCFDRMAIYISLEILRHLRRVSDHIINMSEKLYFITSGISPLTQKKKRWAKDLPEGALKTRVED